MPATRSSRSWASVAAVLLLVVSACSGGGTTTEDTLPYAVAPDGFPSLREILLGETPVETSDPTLLGSQRIAGAITSGLGKILGTGGSVASGGTDDGTGTGGGTAGGYAGSGTGVAGGTGGYGSPPTGGSSGSDGGAIVSGEGGSDGAGSGYGGTSSGGVTVAGGTSGTTSSGSTASGSGGTSGSTSSGSTSSGSTSSGGGVVVAGGSGGTSSSDQSTQSTPAATTPDPTTTASGSVGTSTTSGSGVTIDRPVVSDVGSSEVTATINTTLQRAVDDLLAGRVDTATGTIVDPEVTSADLGFDVVTLTDDVVSIRIDSVLETTSSTPIVLTRALTFDVRTGQAVDAADLGIDTHALARIVVDEVAAAIGSGYCCSPLDAAVANLVVGNDGVVAFVDTAAGLPGHVGLLAVPLSFARVADLVDPSSPLAPHVAPYRSGGVVAATGPATSDGTRKGVSTLEAGVYFFLDGSGGPHLVPVAREIGAADGSAGAIASEALRALLGGPTGAERGMGVSTAVPTATALRGVAVAGGTATVDLSGEFLGGGGSFSVRGRIAQVIYTLTRIDGITDVRFLVDGVPTTVFGGEGVAIPAHADRSDVGGDLLPAILVESPTFGGFAGNPARVSGTANVFEATVRVVLADAEGLVLFDGFTTASCGTGCRGHFAITIPYDVPWAQVGSLVVFEESARDGSQINVREYPVGLLP